MKINLIFLLIGFLISRLHKKYNKKDCICAELLAIGFLIIISYLVYKDYGLVYFEPMGVTKLILLGYLPARVIEWVREK